MHFTERTPSSAWEPIPFADDPNSRFWAWFKPAGAPLGVIVRVPPETFLDYSRRRPLTMRTIVHALGVDSRFVSMWTLYGAPNDGQQGANPTWDYPIPEPGLAPDPTIGIFLHPPTVEMAQPAIFSQVATGSAPAELFARMEAAWNAVLQLELQLGAAAKQLNASLTRVNALNRDLSSEEGRFADQQDKREWHDARRWLRDAATRLARFLKDHQIGMTSAAGKRNGYETIYKQFVVPRKAFDGIEQTEREYESYRKTMQTLLNNMTAALGSAVQEGERRAQQILARIAVKVRAAKSKR